MSYKSTTLKNHDVIYKRIQILFHQLENRIPYLMESTIVIFNYFIPILMKFVHFIAPEFFFIKVLLTYAMQILLINLNLFESM